jgi:DNA repair protein RecO (recombination protein O)
MLIRTRAIVLKGLAVGEADLIVTYLSEDLGLVKAFAKSPRKTGSRFGSSLEPFSFARVSLFGKESAGLLRITGSDVIETFQEIRDNLEKVVHLAPALNITAELLMEKEPEKKVFSLLLLTLKYAKKTEPGQSLLLSLAYLIKLLSLHGFSPKLDLCAGCHRKTRTYHISHGSLFCSDCIGNKAVSEDELKTQDLISISEGARRLYHALLAWHPESIIRIKPSRLLLNQILHLIEEHIRYHVIQKGSPQLSHLLRGRVFQVV